MITKYNDFIKESSDIDEVLDKISREGIHSLNKKEKYILDNIDGDKSYENNIIDDIKQKVEEYGQIITMMDLQADASPLYKDPGQTIHLIERLYIDEVEVVVYGGFKYEMELKDYKVKYEDLNNDILEQINDLLDHAIDNELLEKDI